MASLNLKVFHFKWTNHRMVVLRILLRFKGNVREDRNSQGNLRKLQLRSPHPYHYPVLVRCRRFTYSGVWPQQEDLKATKARPPA